MAFSYYPIAQLRSGDSGDGRGQNRRWPQLLGAEGSLLRGVTKGNVGCGWDLHQLKVKEPPLVRAPDGQPQKTAGHAIDNAHALAAWSNGCRNSLCSLMAGSF